MRRAFAIVVACSAAAHSCFYAPTVPDCANSCAISGKCPSGTSCVDGYCRTRGATGACSCGWEDFTISNVSIDALPAAAASAWEVAADTTYDTGAGASADPPGEAQVAGATQLWVVHVPSMHVAQGATLTITGPYPLVVVADDTIVVEGVLAAAPGSAPPPAGTCQAQNGVVQCAGAGGGGGGNGGMGGAGGPVDSSLGSHAPAEPGLALQGGCPGADGGAPAPTTPGPAGRGGGAIQLVAKNRVEVSSTITAGGEGGGPGSSSPTCTGFVGSASSGGGGGGAGGHILIESCLVQVDGAAKICATGGGGGGGGAVAGVSTVGSNGNCDSPAAGGVQGGVSGTEGGSGGYAGNGDGGDAGAEGAGSVSSSGGGGAVGKIRMHGAVVNVQPTALIHPVATTD